MPSRRSTESSLGEPSEVRFLQNIGLGKQYPASVSDQLSEVKGKLWQGLQNTHGPVFFTKKSNSFASMLLATILRLGGIPSNSSSMSWALTSEAADFGEAETTLPLNLSSSFSFLGALGDDVLLFHG